MSQSGYGVFAVRHGPSEKRALVHAAARAALSIHVIVGPAGRDAPTWRSLQESFLDQIRLVDLFDRTRLFADRRRERVEPDWAAFEAIDDREQEPAIHFVEAALVDLQR